MESTGNFCKVGRFREDEGGNLQLKLMEDLDGKAVNFIRPWFRKWKTQSIYQVLLLHRSTQQRNFVYFCQQVHLYNQNDRYLMEILNEAVSLNEIVMNPGCRALIPAKKISVHKTPFKLSDLTFVDSSYLYDSVNDERNKKLTELDEEWDAPLKRIFNKQKPGQKNPDTHDKECQTDSQEVSKNTSAKNNNSWISQCKADDSVNTSDATKKDFIYFNPNRIDSENQESLRGANGHPGDFAKIPKYTGIGRIGNSPVGEKTVESNKVSHIPFRKRKDITQKISHKDLPKHKSPVWEMEEKFRTKQKPSDIGNGDDDDDYPPYNFRAILRKTEYTAFAHKKEMDPIIHKYDFALKKRSTKTEKSKNEDETTNTELAPGLVIEGKIADL